MSRPVLYLHIFLSFVINFSEQFQIRAANSIDCYSGLSSAYQLILASPSSNLSTVIKFFQVRFGGQKLEAIKSKNLLSLISKK